MSVEVVISCLSAISWRSRFASGFRAMETWTFFLSGESGFRPLFCGAGMVCPSFGRRFDHGVDLLTQRGKLGGAVVVVLAAAGLVAEPQPLAEQE